MAKRKKSATEKLNAPQDPVVKPAPRDMAGMKKGEMMLIPTPQVIKQFVEAIPQGQSMNAGQMRKALAKAHNAEVACPITTGIHLRTVTEAAFEAESQGKPLAGLTPVWRVLDEPAPVLKKLSADQVEKIHAMRVKEGLDKA